MRARRRLGISYVLRRSLMGVASGERAEEKVGCEGRKEEGRRLKAATAAAAAAS